MSSFLTFKFIHFTHDHDQLLFLLSSVKVNTCQFIPVTAHVGSLLRGVLRFTCFPEIKRKQNKLFNFQNTYMLIYQKNHSEVVCSVTLAKYTASKWGTICATIFLYFGQRIRGGNCGLVPFANSEDPDQLASGSALFVIKYVDLNQQRGWSHLKIASRCGILIQHGKG